MKFVRTQKIFGLIFTVIPVLDTGIFLPFELNLAVQNTENLALKDH